MARFTQIAELPQQSRSQLLAWPTIAAAAKIIGLSPSTLTRAVDRRGITKYGFGRRDKKLAPDAVLDLALEYAADVYVVAEQLMLLAEHSGAAQEFVDGVEQTIDAWLAGQARMARSEPDELEIIVRAIRETASPEIAAAIFARAGIKA